MGILNKSGKNGLSFPVCHLEPETMSSVYYVCYDIGKRKFKDRGEGKKKKYSCEKKNLLLFKLFGGSLTVV